MRKGLVKITPMLIRDALKFPANWEIESMNTVVKNGLPIIEAIISGPDFPEVPKAEGAPIKECAIVVHTESLRFEIK